MPRTLRHLRPSLIALLAIFATSLGASEATACTSMRSGEGACATVCGCCAPGASEAPTQAAVVTPEAVRTLQVPMGCEALPGGGCVCRSEEPAAPAQKPASPTTEGRPATGQVSAYIQLGDDAARLPAGLKVPLTQSPPKIPLYLRNARLLF